MKFKFTALLLLAVSLAACSGRVESSETVGGGGIGVPDDSGNQPKPVVAFDY